MSLESIVLCPPCLSLSLLFCRDLCLSGVALSGHPTPLAFAGGTRVHLSRRSLQEGGLLHFYLFIGVLSAGMHDIGWRQAPERCVLAAAQSEQPRLAGGHCVRAVPIWAHSSSRRTPGRRRDQRGPVRRRQRTICVDNLMSLIPVPSAEGFRCSDRDPAGHDSGSSVVP